MTDYRDKNIWLMEGDCLERMKEIPDRSVDVVLSDIPYGISFSKWDILHSNKNSALLGSSPSQKSSTIFKTRGKPLNGWSNADKNRGVEYQDWCIKWCNELFRITKPCSPVLIFSGRQYQHRATIAAEDSGFIFKDCITWNKEHAAFRAQKINCVLKNRRLNSVSEHTRLGNLAPVCEPVLYFIKPYKIGSTITDCFVESGLGVIHTKNITKNLISYPSKVDDKLHETQKPVGLLELLIEMVSQENMTVLDMFMGSGSTGVACKNLNRKFIGIEMDDKYFGIAKDRILGHTANT